MSDWSSRCPDSIRKDKREIENKYGIRVGQTEIYCARCGRPWGFGGHMCMDLRFKKLKEEKKERISEIQKAKDEAYAVLKDLGSKKVAAYLMIPEATVTKRNHRRSIPTKHIEKVLNLQKCV
jgi:hypothetical protein